ncbi:MAG: DUF4129 domain-containing protein [Desulfurococcales archaeon]|nr:DUF4129 domain-containing protein [Desulfurococcales archaeon]
MKQATSIGILALLMILLASNSIDTYSQSSLTPNELERHAPLLGNITVSIEELQKILATLNTTSSNPELNQILEDMNNSLQTRNYENYEKAREALNLYLQNLTQQENVPFDINTIEKLALLASTFLNETNGSVDMAKFAQLLSDLSENKGRNSISYGTDLNRMLNRTGSEQQGSQQSSTPKIPQVPSFTGKPSINFSYGISLLDILKYSILIGLLASGVYLLYRYKHYINAKLSFLTGKIVNRFKYRIYNPQNPKEAIMLCFQQLVKIFSWLGYPMNSWETPREYLSKIRLPPLVETRDTIVELIEKAKYSPREPTGSDAEKCRNILMRVEESEL